MEDRKLITYDEKDVREASIKYFNGDTLAADVWMKKYCLKDENKYYELSPDDMHRRIAKEIARIENKYPNPLKEDDIFETLTEFKRIVPQGSPMSGIGNDIQVVSLSNCYVIGNDGETDSYGGIFKIDQEIAQLEKRRGGVGTDLSFLRPSGSPVKNSAITSTGVVPFMERYSNTTKEVAQDGRRGALMLSIDVHHPDAENFIDAKLQQGKVTGANISVKLTDDFMKAALNNEPFTQMYPVYSKTPKITKEIDANKLWKKIIHNAWKSAEPGILYWDKIISESIPDCYAEYGFETISTNPCVIGSTKIKTNKGDIEIKEIVERFNNGEIFQILSYNESINEMEYKPLYNAQKTKENAEILEIETEDGTKIRLTPDHKVFTEEDGWIEAVKLTINHTILEII